MARESKTEIEVHDAIARHLAPGETLREFTWGATEASISAAYFLFGALGAALTGQNQPGFFIGLTDKRLILMEVKGKTPTGEVHSISTSDIKGLQYRSGGTTGNLNYYIHVNRTLKSIKTWEEKNNYMIDWYSKLGGTSFSLAAGFCLAMAAAEGIILILVFAVLF